MVSARERIVVDGGDWNARSAVKRVPNDSVAAQFEVDHFSLVRLARERSVIGVRSRRGSKEASGTFIRSARPLASDVYPVAPGRAARWTETGGWQHFERSIKGCAEHQEGMPFDGRGQ